MAFLLVNTPAQTQPPGMGIDRYLETAKTIIIGKCLSVGPVNILLKSHVEIEILHVVKGRETLRQITVLSLHPMVVGERYLLRTEHATTAAGNYFTVDTVDSAIALSRHEQIETLKKLSPRIVVLRTMNSRAYDLERDIEQLTYELEALNKARKEN